MKKQKSDQATFDHIVNHMLTQNCRSLLRGKVKRLTGVECGYRGGHSGELKCAIGCLIDDWLYSPALEGVGVYTDAVRNAIAWSGWSTNLPLDRLQEIHDGEDARDWEAHLAAFAEINGLKFRPKVKR